MAIVSVLDVAEFILHYYKKRRVRVTAWQLQKLTYYSQAWSLVWDDKPMFRERIEAWANGPVAPDLYEEHKGDFYVTTVHGNPDKLNDSQRETILAVLKYYGDKSSQWLSDLTHSEDPWIIARRGVPDSARSNQEITLASMAEYYGSL